MDTFNIISTVHNPVIKLKGIQICFNMSVVCIDSILYISWYTGLSACLEKIIINEQLTNMI